MTVTNQKAWLLQHPGKPFIVPSVESGTLFYYPAIISVPLTVKPLIKKKTEISPKGPALISMAKGAFIHTFQKIDASELTLEQFLQSLIGVLVATPRAYLIDELVCKGADGEKRQVRGLFVKLAGSELVVPGGKESELVIVFTAIGRDGKTGKFFEAISSENYRNVADGKAIFLLKETDIGDQVDDVAIKNIGGWRGIDLPKYEEIAREIIFSTRPAKNVLDQASAGQESIEMVIKSCVKIISKNARGFVLEPSAAIDSSKGKIGKPAKSAQEVTGYRAEPAGEREDPYTTPVKEVTEYRVEPMGVTDGQYATPAYSVEKSINTQPTYAYQA